ncbi:galactokinase [Ideonella sp. 4Y11]|uniref:Galactokinase n=1 Tax=Ideonella aquatica TaxID=2824119 RepID=A0A940YNU0_9BURK|nr:galactokinase [Ideonella aquatica]MBQ0959761.1 galactokinase [Ideonella aquatica]
MSSPLIQRAIASYIGAFDAPPQTLVQAPGRVNLIGEHTDYNDGFVLPCAIDFHTVVAIGPRRDGRVRVIAADLNHAGDEFTLGETIAHAGPRSAWADYVRGAVQMAVREGLPLAGANLAIAGDVPQGAGLSSSAALEVAVLQALKSLLDSPVPSPTRLAQLAQAAENDYVGCQCGIMDQLISACGRADHALLIDCRSLEARPAPLPDDMAVMIVHSRVRRGLVESAYNERRQQCEQAARHLGVSHLRDASLTQLVAAGWHLDDVVFRRARHVITENARTLAAHEALTRGDLVTMGRLMAESHVSMRDDFEITVPAIDDLVTLLQAEIGPQGGARMTGGGFGGCCVALMPTDQTERVAAAVEAGYRSPDGDPPRIWVTRAVDGAGPLPR